MDQHTNEKARQKDLDVWIIKYYHMADRQPVFLVWYTDVDENGTDKLFTFKTGEIFATTSLERLKETVVQNLRHTNDFENLKEWLMLPDQEQPYFYPIDTICNAIKLKNYDHQTLEVMTNFINLFGDFVYQNESNLHLKPLMDQKHIRKVWDYYYNAVFWPRFNDKQKFETWKGPVFRVNAKKLEEEFWRLITCFEENMIIVR